MTREEAINNLKYFIDTYIAVRGEEDTIAVSLDNVDVEALDMAIKALEQEPCKDAISRKAVLSKIKEVCFSEEWLQFRIDNGSNGQRDFLINYIEKLSSVTPARKKGHWINIDKTHSKCDKCESIFEIVSVNGEANYCPNCGCFMSERGK